MSHIEPSPPLRELMASRDTINREVFADFLDNYDEQHRKLSQELVYLYFEEAASRMAEIEAGLAISDFESCGEATRNMSDSARSFGLVKVVSKCGALKSCLRSPTPRREQLQSYFAELLNAQNEVEACLRQWYCGKS
ncbi:hypothetical protein FIBSPDRAFT_1043858 [Athelia psychrophila]|uniref:HPt domain-containing protein n=1 Tax=Athelia psychrophila TaxID=1759441 RepID=A0A166KHT7_9AGAM|nr:hypothetical protein FIBSPDRAFT_1043858 [Fibularhizoctonia sp. CBS 109695]